MAQHKKDNHLEQNLRKTLEESDVRAFRKAARQAMEEHKKKRPASNRLKIVRWAVRIAAAIVLILVIVLVLRNQLLKEPPAQLAQTYLEAYDPGIDTFESMIVRDISRGDSLSLQRTQRVQQAWKELVSLYENERYEAALKQLARIENLDPGRTIITETQWNLYRGMCQLQLGNPDLALDIFQQVQAPYLEKATFFSAIALLQLQRVEEAKDILEKIDAAEAHFFKEAAHKLLRDL